MSAEISMPSDTPGRSKEKPKKKPNQAELKFFAWAPRKVNCCSLFISARKKPKKKKKMKHKMTQKIYQISASGEMAMTTSVAANLQLGK